MATQKNLNLDDKLFTPIIKWEEKDKLQVASEAFNFWKNATRNVHETYVRFNRLYMNQYKSDSNLLGSKLLFTKHNEVQSMLRSETKDIKFYPRKDSDKDKVDNLKDVRNYDEEEMNWNKVSRIWDNDAGLYGFGCVSVAGFDSEKGTMLARNINPFFAVYDVLASSRESMRFGGEITCMTVDEMVRQFGKEKVKKALSNKKIEKKSGVDENDIQVNRVREYSTGLMNTQNDLKNTLAYYELVDLYISHSGQLYRIVSDINFNTILHEEECDYEDGAKDKITGKRASLIPYLYKSLYKLPSSIQGLGVGHVVEDDHKADVQITNYMFEGVKQDATPRMLYQIDGLVNPRDLRYATANRNIATKGSPSQVTAPFPKTGVVSDSTMSFLNLIQNRSDNALGSSRILRASMTQAQKSATEVAIAKAKQDELVADRVKDLVEEEKNVWKTWVARMRKYYPEAEKKNIRVLGKTGEAKIKSLAKIDFIPQTDPDIVIESKLVSEPMRIIARNELANTLPYLEKVGGNVKDALRRIYRLSDMTENQINAVIPQTPDEMRATMENEVINQGTSPLIDPEDNDQEHLAVHQFAEDNDANQRHKLAHMLNYLRKAKENKQMEAKNMIQTGGGMTGMPQMQSPQGELPEVAPQADKMAGVEQIMSQYRQ